MRRNSAIPLFGCHYQIADGDIGLLQILKRGLFLKNKHRKNLLHIHLKHLIRQILPTRTRHLGPAFLKAS